MASLVDLAKQLEKENTKSVPVKNLTEAEKKALGVKEGQEFVEVLMEPKIKDPKPKEKEATEEATEGPEVGASNEVEVADDTPEEVPSASDLESVGNVGISEAKPSPTPKAPEVEVTKNEIEEYFRCILAMQRYRETFSIFKGRAKVTFRSKTANETLKLLTLIPRIKNRLGYVNSTAAATIIQNLNFLICLESVSVDGKDLDIVPINIENILEDELISKASKVNSDMSAVMYKACIGKFQIFDAKNTALSNKVAEENF